MAGTLTIQGMSAGLPSGQKQIGPLTITGNNPVGEILDATLAVGDNTFTVPSGSVGATAVLIVLGTGGVAATVKVRTNLNASDQGLEIAPYSGIGFTVFPLPAGTTELILNASATVGPIELSFI